MSATKPLTIKQCLADAESLLTSPKSQSQQDAAKLEAEVLLAFTLNKPRSYLYTWPEQEINIAQQNQFNSLLERRCAGEPVAYMTGVREFWGLNLKVSPATLIPRPETERLVEIALSYIPENEAVRVADLGTGSGAIALAIASERPMASIVATDISDAALAVARENLTTHGLSNVRLHQGHWFDALYSSDEARSQFNFIVANPPYVAEGDPHLHQGDLRFEPAMALSSGEDGLNDLRTIIQNATQHLAKGAHLLLEHGYDQARVVGDLFDKSGYSEVQCFSDYSARERATIGRW